MQEVCAILEQLVAEGVVRQYAVGGATAAGFHGEPLATRDIDVFVFVEPAPGSLLVTLEPIFRRLEALGFSEFEEEALLVHGYPVQFLSASPGLETEAVKQAITAEGEGRKVRVMRPEHLAALALATGRPKDRARLVYLLALPDFDRPAFREILSRHHLTDRWSQWSAALGLE
jgi:hypothetical protein